MKQFIFPYIILKECREASNYYKEVFDGEVIYEMLGKDTPNCPEGFEEKIMHLQLKFNGNQIYMAEEDIEVTDAIQIHLDYENLEDMTAAFDKMSKKGKVQQDLGESFWGAIYGNIKDQFGVTWQFHHALPRE